ncbi:hypothetical protein BRO54_3886 [Geobacillus proteiniphilus]|uniref:Uncharacterized protein n=2 Tax=Geobacillus proteiniphilus TaxID=860353 RepID=A0A1Q5SDW3_9BACL|nr:hypothetical protein BRO54_3886 [Geobacillus proteiniphilus]
MIFYTFFLEKTEYMIILRQKIIQKCLIKLTFFPQKVITKTVHLFLVPSFHAPDKIIDGAKAARFVKKTSLYIVVNIQFM